MKIVLICHDNEPLSKEGMSRWIASFADLAGVIIISENPGRLSKRIKMEIKRSGLFGFLDVIAFRVYHRIFKSSIDHKYQQEALAYLTTQYPPYDDKTQILVTHSPNTTKVRDFLASFSPDFIVARCKSILKREIFLQASKGTFVMHPGICPEYRNSHGCFWACVNEDYEKIGMTLLKIDEGIDTGPVYGYFGGAFDLLQETHNTIQAKVVFENLPAIEEKFHEIYRGEATPIDVTGRDSGTWGQPWLSKYLKWRMRYKK